MRIRPYTDDDAAAAVMLLNACECGDPVTERGWRDFVAYSYNRAGRDFAVAGEMDGLLTSYALDDLRHLRIYVHPDRRRQGVGTALLAVHTGAVEQCNCLASWAPGRAFLDHHGFAPHVRSLDMVREGPPPAPVAPPPGVRLRPAEPRDDEAWMALSEEAYRGTPGYTPTTPADLAAYRAAPGSHLWIAEEDGRVLGLCHTILWQETRPFINSVVVAPAARGRGLGRALTVAGLRTLGPARVELNVRADNRPAVRIYESLGFRTVEEVITYRRYNDDR